MLNTTTTEPPREQAAPKLYCEPDKATALDFGRSEVVANNLGAMGPDSGIERLTFQGIATYQGSSVDLVVKANGDYVPHNSSDNGIIRNHGQINVRSGRAVELLFMFRYSASRDSVQLPEFYLTLLDIDQSDGEHQERFYISGFDLAVEEELKDYETELLPDGRTLYKSLHTGGSWDDPADPAKLGSVADPSNPSDTVDQRRRAVMFVFRDTSQFSITLEVGAVANQDEEDKNGPTSSGRNFMLAGESNLIDRCPTL